MRLNRRPAIRPLAGALVISSLLGAPWLDRPIGIKEATAEERKHMTDPKTAKQGAIEQIRGLETRLLNSEDPKLRQTIAQQIHDIGVSHPLNSAERRAAANALLRGWEAEGNLQTMKRIYLMIKDLRFKIRRQTGKETFWITPREGIGKVRREIEVDTYHIVGPIPPKRTPPPLEYGIAGPVDPGSAVPRKTTPQEQAEQKARPPRRREVDLGTWEPGKPMSPSTLGMGQVSPEERMRYERSLQDRKKAAMVATTTQQTAEKIMARLPKARTEAGKKAQAGISRKALERAALKKAKERRPIKQAAPKDYTVGGIIVPSLMPFAIAVGWDYTNKGFEFKPAISIFPISAALAIYQLVDTIADDIEKKRREATRPNLPYKMPSTLPEVPAEIKKKVKLTALDRYSLIGILDDPKAKDRDRRLALFLLASYRVKEAKPLLESIVRDPYAHKADLVLRRMAKMALKKMGGA